MKNLWYLVNVVWYDGCDAYVSKFIVQAEMATDKIGGTPYPSLTHDSERRVREYLKGNGEILKFDPLYSLSFDNILAFESDERPEYQTAYNRFKEIWF